MKAFKLLGHRFLCMMKWLRWLVVIWWPGWWTTIASLLDTKMNGRLGSSRKKAGYSPALIAGEGFEPPTFGL